MVEQPFVVKAQPTQPLRISDVTSAPLDMHMGSASQQATIHLPPAAVNVIEITNCAGQLVGRYHAVDNTYHPVEGKP